MDSTILGRRSSRHPRCARSESCTGVPVLVQASVPETNPSGYHLGRAYWRVSKGELVLLERCCFTFRIRSGAEDVYQARHDAMTSELRAVATRAGMRNYTLFRSGTQVVGYVECSPDVSTAFALANAEELSRQWRQAMSDILDDGDGTEAEPLFFTEVWHHD
jgi:L-rhamnose mutarotase